LYSGLRDRDGVVVVKRDVKGRYVVTCGSMSNYRKHVGRVYLVFGAAGAVVTT
jgi:hypothetical protein